MFICELDARLCYATSEPQKVKRYILSRSKTPHRTASALTMCNVQERDEI